MNKQRKKTIESNEISEIYTFTLGGFPQKVLIEGKSRTLPIVITLHSGPGTPIPFSVGCRGLFPVFTDNFIMVYWDQLGCGINNHKLDDHFSIQTFVEMTSNLLSEIKQEFPDNKVYILATSWGTVISAMVSELRANDIDGVVATGQIVKDMFFGEEVFQTLKKSNIPQKKLDIIKNIKPENATSKELQLVSSCLKKYTNAYNNKSGQKSPMTSIIMGLLSSPDYSFRDFRAIIDNGYKANNSLWRELLSIDLSATISNLRIPYIILQGETDVVASTSTIKKVVEMSANENLKIYTVKNTGHYPGTDMMKMVLEKLSELSR